MCLSEKHNGKQPQRETKKKVGGLFSCLHYMADVLPTFDPTLIYIYFNCLDVCRNELYLRNRGQMIAHTISRGALRTDGRTEWHRKNENPTLGRCCQEWKCAYGATRTMPAGHGGAEGKRCAYFVDERYLASLGLMALEISYRIPNADIVPHNREITDWGLDL